MAAVERKCLDCESDDLGQTGPTTFYCKRCLSSRTSFLINGIHGLPDCISAGSDLEAIIKTLAANKRNMAGWTLAPGSRVLGYVIREMGFHHNPSARHVIRLLQSLDEEGSITLAKESSAGSGKRFLYQINDEIASGRLGED